MSKIPPAKSKQPSGVVGVDVTARRTWDKEHYAQLAKDGALDFKDPLAAKKEQLKEKQKEKKQKLATYERSTVDQVKAKLQGYNKRKQEQEINLEERIKRVEAMQERAKRAKKEQKEQEEKEKQKDEVPLEDIDLAAFGLPTGFSTKK
eukprot:TRINITY_DN3830_c0_g1_i2.p1 TRINITY_DN3830_c0_g1~~TRINITY_DN3830_c0_g1_i2.p1  ORF type:complete len:148 (+),score=64.80 TRINITY_DN3830_c0_g1_i2:96-539(+)